MLIDAVMDCKNKITVNPFKYKSNKMNNGEFCFFDDELKWVISSQELDPNRGIGNMVIGGSPVFLIGAQPLTNTCQITVEFPYPILFKNLNFDYTTNSSPFITKEFTLDRNLWEEFYFFTYTITNLSTTNLTNKGRELVKYLENKIVKVLKIPLDNEVKNYYIFTDQLTKDIEQLTPEEYQIISDFLDGIIISKSDAIINLKYIYYYEDANQNIVYLYENFYILGVRVSLTNLVLSPLYPFTLKTFSITTDINLELEKHHLNIFYKNLFIPKYFEEYDFIPSITKTYFDMLEYKDR